MLWHRGQWTKQSGKMDDSYYHLDWNMSKDNSWTGAWEGLEDQDALTKFSKGGVEEAIFQKMYIPPQKVIKIFFAGEVHHHWALKTHQKQFPLIKKNCICQIVSRKRTPDSDLIFLPDNNHQKRISTNTSTSSPLFPTLLQNWDIPP